MRAFLEQYGIAIFIIIILGIMTLMANGLGLEVKKKLSEEVNRFTQSAKTENTTAQNNSGYDGLDGTVGGEDEKKPGHILITGSEFNELILTSTTSIEFLNTAAPTDVDTIDVSEEQDGSVVAWYEGTNFYIAPKETGHIMYANPDSSYMFDCAEWDEDGPYAVIHIEKADFNNLNTSKVVNMEDMFVKFGTPEDNTSCNVSGLEKFNVSNVTNMSSMFYGAFDKNDIVNLDLSNWDVSSVTNMCAMFSNMGEDATIVELKGLNNWDVSSVEDMGAMFNGMAYRATSFNLDLSGWGNTTSNLTSTRSMFATTGYYAETFNLNLSNWNTSNVTKMYSMFENTGHNSKTFKIVGLDDWNVSRVTQMEGMFMETGRNATTFDIGNLSNWNTSSVKYMRHMFYYAGTNANYSLNLSSWDVSKVTEHSNFNTGVGSKITSPTWK